MTIRNLATSNKRARNFNLNLRVSTGTNYVINQAMHSLYSITQVASHLQTMDMLADFL